MSLQILSVTSEEVASQFVYYIFIVSYNNQKEWEIKKRYTDFVNLHDLLKPPFLLPPKRYFSTSKSVVEERKVQLRQYLLQCVQFINNPIFRTFIGIDKEIEKTRIEFKQDFYEDIQSIGLQLDQIDSLIQKRVECVRNNQIHQSYKINQDIQLKVQPLKDYLPTLYRLIQEDKTVGNELDRKMKNYREAEMKIQSILKQIQESPRKRVFGNTSPSSGSIPISSNPSNVPITGSFNKSDSMPIIQGGSSLPNAQQLLQNQDQQLSLIMQSLRVQKRIGQEMHAEIDLQNKILDDINTDVDKVDRKVKITSKRTQKLT